ncbi:MAG: YggS family pyridoxal phosphate-dependent enzyme [Gammaproteobacteria bacterium]|nr:YggS family pyridoxal phosphate-dependent enzyme [Gammaproteobacteria bacterium]
MNQLAETAVGEALNRVKQRIRAAESDYGRTPGSVALLAVSKTKPVAALREAIAAGQRAFGENYLDDALTKIEALKSENCEWHFIGAIQSNKTRQIAAHFDWVHAIDREKIASRLASQRPDDLPPLNCCIQLNLDDENSKAGITAAALPDLCAHLAGLPRLALRGLMIIPAPRHTLAEQRAVFAEVHRLFSEQQALWPQMDTLSLGMTNDLEAAVAEGSTMVRIGTAIFGARTS